MRPRFYNHEFITKERKGSQDPMKNKNGTRLTFSFKPTFQAWFYLWANSNSDFLCQAPLTG
jgi:hypothetical protein